MDEASPRMTMSWALSRFQSRQRVTGRQGDLRLEEEQVLETEEGVDGEEGKHQLNEFGSGAHTGQWV
jgi:hypothetical protein